MKSFQFIRHGETDWNKNYIYQGHNDIPLNKTGIAQAKTLAQNISLDNVSQIFVSPLLRAKQTSLIINEFHQNKCEIIEVPDLMECRSEQSARFLLNLKGVTHMPSFEHVTHETETPEEFFNRVKLGLDHVHKTAKDEKPLIVAHGGVCSALCLNLKIDFFKTPNCCLIDFNFLDNKYTKQFVHYNT